MWRRMFLVLATALLFGCGGGGAKTVYHHRMTTIGQELTDLKAARDSGAITDTEYKEQREKILEGEE